jgi:hypothetical protein
VYPTRIRGLRRRHTAWVVGVVWLIGILSMIVLGDVLAR